MINNITDDCVKTSKEMFLSVFSAFSPLENVIIPLVSPSPALTAAASPAAPAMFSLTAAAVTATASTPVASPKQAAGGSADKESYATDGIKILALYHRAPITDEQAPSLHMFDALVRHFESVGECSVLSFSVVHPARRVKHANAFAI